MCFIISIHERKIAIRKKREKIATLSNQTRNDTEENETTT